MRLTVFPARAVCIAAAFISALHAAVPASAAGSLYGGPYHSAEGDSTAMPGEVFIITAEELARFDINTISDIIEHLPGVYVLQDGPPASRTRFSVDGRTVSGMTLLVNGVPFADPYNEDPLGAFLTFSRVRRVEVIYSSSPALTGRVSAGGIINIVIEEGGRKPPVAAGDFTWGGGGRKARRAWFSSPDAFIGGTIAYDEYMQDYFHSLEDDPSALLGEYNSRAVLMDLTLRGRAGDRVLVRLRTFEDTYTGTRTWPEKRDPFDPPENVRYDGIDSEIRYVRGGAEVSLRQRYVEMVRRTGRSAGLVLGGAASWRGAAGSNVIKSFVSVERAAFENRLAGEPFSPDIDRVECGAAAGGTVGSFRWRGGLSAGYMTAVGLYLGGEAALSRGDENGLYQTLMAARRVRTPTAEELYQPDIEYLPGGSAVRTSGNPDLGYERSDEVSLGLGYGSLVKADIFARAESDRIALAGAAPAVYESSGRDDVIGIRASLGSGGSLGLASFDYGWKAYGSWFAERAEITPGVPEYNLRGSFWLSRATFKRTEMLTLRVDAVETGPRLFAGTELGRYSVVDLSLSLTILGATARFEVKNVLDEKYGTVPGMLMPGTHYRFGLNWRVFD